MKLRTSSINSFVMNINSKELYINMGNDIPLWNDLYSYEEQDDDVKQFWENEAMKLLNGVTINGVFPEKEPSTLLMDSQRPGYQISISGR